MRDHEESVAIPLAEETMHVSKRPIERRVRISTVTEDVPTGFVEDLRAERIDIQHVTVERELNERPDIRFEDDVMIIPVIEERLVIEKKLFLVEEVHVRRIEGVERVERPVTLKRQRVVVDRHETSGAATHHQED